MMRHVAKKYTRKLRKPATGQNDKRKAADEDRRPGWDVRFELASSPLYVPYAIVTVFCSQYIDLMRCTGYCFRSVLHEAFSRPTGTRLDLLAALLGTCMHGDCLEHCRDVMQTRRLSERKPRVSKPNFADFPGFPSQNDPGALNSVSVSEATGVSDLSAPDNVDYGAVLDSLASLSMSAPARTAVRPVSASSRSARSCRSENRVNPQRSITQAYAHHESPHETAARHSMPNARSSGQHFDCASSTTSNDDSSPTGARQRPAALTYGHPTPVSSQCAVLRTEIGAAPEFSQTEIPTAPKRTFSAVTTASKLPRHEDELAAKVRSSLLQGTYAQRCPIMNT